MPLVVLFGNDLDLLQPPAPPSNLSGVNIAPKIRRHFHFPDPSSDSPRTPLLTTTYSALPLPSPPLATLTNLEAWETIESNPHLFNHGHSIDTCSLERHLSSHPNQSWVKSLIKSLDDGFWPLHSGAPPEPPDRQKLDNVLRMPKISQDRELIQQTAEEEFEKGWISEAFDELLPGRVVNPFFFEALTEPP